MIGDICCPHCRSVLREGVCPECDSRFEVTADIPQLVVGGSEAARAQAAYFDDAVDVEFEIERPSGTPSLYRWLIAEKFRRALGGADLTGRTALVVCGGSGMDAEFLARAGADVMSSDISIGAARRAVERARRHDAAITSVVADVERLPFGDRSVDVVYVHDGLHHIENPYAGLREMGRVARRAVAVTEPADALLTAVAVKTGLALEREDAGNRVARLRLADVCAALEGEGFRIAHASRYAMFYRHEPGVAMRVLSHPLLLPLAKLGFRLANLLVGRAGNKLVVLALRP